MYEVPFENTRKTTRKTTMTAAPSLLTMNHAAPNARCGASFQTLFRWKESVYKLVWGHMVVYYMMYVSLTILYQFILNEEGKKHFEGLTRYFSKSASTLNLMIMLGFFTSTTLQRLFSMQTTVPGTAKIISLFIMSLKTNLPEGSIIVKHYARWAVLSWVLAVRSVSKPVRQKYPDMISLQIKGILEPNERLILERAKINGDPAPRPLVVIDWMLLLLKECIIYGRYSNKSCHHKNVELLMVFKKSCGNMIKFATKSLPHALIQAVIIAVYYFGLVTMLARDLSSQGVCEKEGQQDRFNEDSVVRAIVSYIPIMPIMQFFIFFAWLTLGRMAVNPFGDDETDIDLDVLFESHIEDYQRLIQIYDTNLEDFFPDWPQMPMNGVASMSAASASQFQLATSSDVDSPEIPLLSVTGATPPYEENNSRSPRKETITLKVGDSNVSIISIDDDDASIKASW